MSKSLIPSELLNKRMLLGDFRYLQQAYELPSLDDVEKLMTGIETAETPLDDMVELAVQMIYSMCSREDKAFTLDQARDLLDLVPLGEELRVMMQGWFGQNPTEGAVPPTGQLEQAV